MTREIGYWLGFGGTRPPLNIFLEKGGGGHFLPLPPLCRRPYMSHLLHLCLDLDVKVEPCTLVTGLLYTPLDGD